MIKWKQWLAALMSTAKVKLSKRQAQYKANFDKRLRQHTEVIRIGDRVFVKKEYTNTKVDQKHKLSPVATGPYRVVDVAQDTVVIETDTNFRERLSRDRLTLAPKVVDTPSTIRTTTTPVTRHGTAPAPPIGRRQVVDTTAPNRGLADLTTPQGDSTSSSTSRVWVRRPVPAATPHPSVAQRDTDPENGDTTVYPEHDDTVDIDLDDDDSDADLGEQEHGDEPTPRRPVTRSQNRHSTPSTTPHDTALPGNHATPRSTLKFTTTPQHKRTTNSKIGEQSAVPSALNAETTKPSVHFDDPERLPEASIQADTSSVRDNGVETPRSTGDSPVITPRTPKSGDSQPSITMKTSPPILDANQLHHDQSKTAPPATVDRSTHALRDIPHKSLTPPADTQANLPSLDGGEEESRPIRRSERLQSRSSDEQSRKPPQPPTSRSNQSRKQRKVSFNTPEATVINYPNANTVGDKRGTMTRKFVVEKILNHGHADDGELLHQVRWYGYSPEADTWEPTRNIPRNMLVRYYKRRKLPLPANINDANDG